MVKIKNKNIKGIIDKQFKNIGKVLIAINGNPFDKILVNESDIVYG